MLNLERLHNTIELIRSGATARPRAQGWTTAYIELIVGDILLGDPDNSYLYVGETRITVEYAFRQVLKRLSEFGITPIRHTYDFAEFASGQKFLAKSAQQVRQYNGVRGFSFNRVFVDIALDLRSSSFQEDFRRELYPSISSTNGDII